MEKTNKSKERQPPLPFVGKHNKYQIGKLIDQGSFGIVYQANQTINPSKKYAVKFQIPQLKGMDILQQCRIYKHMLLHKIDQKKHYIPRLYYCAKQNQHYLLVMQLMGPSLRKILIEKQIKIHKLPTMILPMNLLLSLVPQMIDSLQYIHQRGIIHRDIKPDNFCQGINQNSNQMYLVDFGLAKKYIINGQHIPFTKTNAIVGNRVFASVNNHCLSEQSRRDDLESLGYVLIDLATGSLPWRTITDTCNNRRIKLIGQMKQSINLQILCNNLPISFLRYMEAVRSLSFKEQPNYEYYRNLFRLAYFDLQQNSIKENIYD